MKRTLFLLFTLVVTTMSFGEDYVDSFAANLALTRAAVLECVNKTNVTIEDMMHFDQIMEDNLQTDFDDTALKVGCLFSCLLQKKEMMTDAHLDVDKMKEIVSSKFKGRRPEALALRFQVLDTCTDRVKTKTNECEVSLKFVVCLVNEVRRIQKSNNNNNNE